MNTEPRMKVSPRCTSGRRILAAAASCAVTLVTSPVFAAEQPPDAAAHALFVRVGTAAVFYEPSATVRSGGAVVPGAGAEVDPNFTAALEIGIYPFSRRGSLENVALCLSLGLPPTAAVEGAGSTAAAGTLGKATFGPAMLTAQVHARQMRIVQPYVGVGLAYAFVFDTEDGAMSQLSVDPAFGAVFQAGVEVGIGARWALFADAKQVLLSTHASGSLGGMPTSADLTLNPFVTTMGGVLRF